MKLNHRRGNPNCWRIIWRRREPKLAVAIKSVQPETKTMSKTATLTSDEARCKARAERYLAETQKILRQLATERQRAARRPRLQSNLVEQVKEILHGK
jgi:hypothetical protein